MNDKRLLHNLVGITTDVSVLLRETCIVALFCLLFSRPVTFKSLLTRVGISKVTTGIVEIDLNGAGGTVATLSAKIPGWLLAGHVDKDKLHWSGDGAKNVAATLSPKSTEGEKVCVTTHAYLRADAPSGAHLGGKVIGVVPANGQVEVIALPDYSSAIATGYFCWVKVQPL